MLIFRWQNNTKFNEKQKCELDFRLHRIAALTQPFDYWYLSFFWVQSGGIKIGSDLHLFVQPQTCRWGSSITRSMRNLMGKRSKLWIKLSPRPRDDCRQTSNGLTVISNQWNDNNHCLNPSSSKHTPGLANQVWAEQVQMGNMQCCASWNTPIYLAKCFPWSNS